MVIRRSIGVSGYLSFQSAGIKTNIQTHSRIWSSHRHIGWCLLTNLSAVAVFSKILWPTITILVTLPPLCPPYFQAGTSLNLHVTSLILTRLWVKCGPAGMRAAGVTKSKCAKPNTIANPNTNPIPNTNPNLTLSLTLLTLNRSH